MVENGILWWKLDFFSLKMEFLWWKIGFCGETRNFDVEIEICCEKWKFLVEDGNL